MSETATRYPRLLSCITVLGAVGLSASCRATARLETPCVFPESSESVVTFDYPSDPDSTFRGQVVDAGLSPIEGAQISLKPGVIGAMTDSSGRFRLDGVPRGRYRLTVQRIPYASVSDSVTFSEFGVRVAVVLVQTQPHHGVCIRPAG